MATKTFRTIYLSDELDLRITQKAELEGLSISKLVRYALENHLKDNSTAYEIEGIMDQEKPGKMEN